MATKINFVTSQNNIKSKNNKTPKIKLNEKVKKIEKIAPVTTNLIFVDNAKVEDGNITDSMMHPSECTKLLVCRAYQLTRGMPPVIEWTGKFDAIAIAKEELNRRVIPLAIVRDIPDGRMPNGFREEVWSVRDMDIRDW